MSSGASNGYLVLRDLLVDALVLDGVEVPDPKSTTDPKYRGAFRGYFDVPAGTHTVVGRVSGKEHATTVEVLPGWATVKRFDVDGGWGDDDAETERHYRHLALSGSMAEAGALRPWPIPAPASAPPAKTRTFGDADFAWLRESFAEAAGARADSAAVQRYIDALRWHYILDEEMGVQATYFARLGRELTEHVRSRPELLGTGAATYIDYFAVDLVDAGKPETIEAGQELAAALEKARKTLPTPAAASAPVASPAPASGGAKTGSPLVSIALAVALVIGVVLVLRRGADTPPPPATTTPTASASTGSAVVDLASSRKLVSLFAHEADLAHATDLVDEASLLESALGKDDCIAARRPYDVLKEKKIDLTQHTALVLAQIRMLTTVGAYCNAWSGDNGKRW